MRLCISILILFFLVPILSNAAQQQNASLKQIFAISVDGTKADLDAHPDKAAEHRKNPGKYNTDAVISISSGDIVLWYSDEQFSIDKIEQLGDSKQGEDEPFVRTLKGEKSQALYPGGPQAVISGPARQNLKLTGKYKGMDANYYKLTYKYESGKYKGALVDPHIIIHK